MSAGYAILLDLADRPVLVVGGGRTATRKVRGLLEAGARVRVVSPALGDELRELADRGAIAWEARPAAAADLDEPATPALAFLCTDDPEVNAGLAGEAATRRIPTNRVDEPGGGDFQVPARAGRGALRLFVSTGGASPALARRLRIRLEEVLAEGWDRALDGLEVLRREIRERVPAEAARADFWARFPTPRAMDALLGGREAEVREEVDRCVSSLSG